MAYEMARQLLQRGMEVSVVLLLDTPPLPLHQLQVNQPEELLRLVDPFRERAPAAWEGFATAIAKDSPFRELLMVHAHAFATYAPGRSQVPIVYIRARERNEVLERHAERWWMDHTDGSFSLHNIPGNHFTMMEPPYVTAVASVVRRELMQEERGPTHMERGLAGSEGFRSKM